MCSQSKLNELSDRQDETCGCHGHNAPLWRPSDAFIAQSHLQHFMDDLADTYDLSFTNYEDIWQWSVNHIPEFWDKVWDYCGVIGQKGTRVFEDNYDMIAARFFPDAHLNYAHNLLRCRDADKVAIIFCDERGLEREISFAELYNSVSRLAQALKAAGVQKHDRVAAYMPNIPETIIGALATASIGAVWSSASPDFGVQGVIDRFGQIDPKILICVDGYTYNGKPQDCLPKIKDIQPALHGLQKTVVVPFLQDEPDVSDLSDSTLFGEFVAPYSAQNIDFESVAFDHPLFIMFSSGTTGVPKCIVHGHGGTLLQHLKEHQLQCDVKSGDRVFYFTTCGWMMWNWLISALASEATLLLYDGNPFYPDGHVLWDYTSRHHCTLFGTAAKYIDALKKEGIYPSETHDLSALRTITSTGSPLVHESFDFVYEHIKEDVHLASISGGTDIVSCFMLGNPISPVWRGEIQGPGLGMAIDVYNDNGLPVSGEDCQGELVCTKPFPSMPVKFWNDPGDKKYKAAYFESYDNVWCHGDWIERTVHNGIIIHGRSDATLNPGGVRIGTAEIYRQVEQIPNVLECLAVGQDWHGDVRIILFVRLREGLVLDDALVKEIVSRIRAGASPRHVPAKCVQIADIPRTKSGKIVELAVRNIIHGRPVKNVEALANPQALDLYKNLVELQS